MKYRSIDSLQDFEFHDAELQNGQIVGNTFTASLRMLNIHKNTPQNGGEFDMEIERAQITFEGMRALTIGHDQMLRTGPDDNTHTIEPVSYNGIEAHDALLAELDHGVTLHSFSQPSPGFCIIDSSSSTSFFSDSSFITIKFSFDRAIIEWDKYCGKAWYDTDRWREYRRRLKEKKNEGQERF